MTIVVKVLRMKAAVVLLNGIFKDHSSEKGHHLGEDKLAVVHNSGLVTATYLGTVVN